MTTTIDHTLKGGKNRPANARVYTREDWVRDVIERLRPDFLACGESLPTSIRVGVGFTSKGARSNRIGECWYPGAVADGHHELIVVPTLTDGVRVVDVIAHELVHVALGPEAKHGPDFRRLAVAIGLDGKMTATVAGPAMAARAAAIVAEIGPFPNPGIDLGERIAAHPKQTTRMLKVTCPDCDYAVRTTRTWLDVGLPTCPCGTLMTEGGA